jgi:hypothetical protein
MTSFDILFQTNRFNLSEAKEHFINPCCFGEDLAEWLPEQLAKKESAQMRLTRKTGVGKCLPNRALRAISWGLPDIPARGQSIRTMESGESWWRRGARSGKASGQEQET